MTEREPPSEPAPQPQNSHSRVARGAGRMGVATLMSRVLGLVREQVFAYLFGASNAADAFNTAFRIPNLLRDLFAEGAMSAAFVPNFTRALVQSRKHAFELLAGVLIVCGCLVSVLAALGIAFAEPLVSLYASSFRAVEGKFELSVALTQVMFPFFPFVAMAAVVMGALNALGFFFLPAFAPVLFNIASIAAGVIVCPLLARYSSISPIHGMAWGVVAGGFLQFYVQWWQVRRQGLVLSQVRHAVVAPLKVEGVKRVLWLLVPGTVGLAATQLGILINSIYATGAGTGAVSWLNYAFRLMQFPIGVFGVSIAVATLPEVARRLAASDAAGAGREVNQSLRMAFAVNLPAAAGLIAAGLPIVQLLFEHGQFSSLDSRQTADAVVWYAAGLPGYSAVKVLVPVYYALGTTRIPVITSFAMVGLNAAINHWFLNVLQFPFWSLAVATSVTATLNAVLLAAFLWPKLRTLIDRGLVRALVLHGITSVAIGFAAAATIRSVGGLAPWVQSFVWGRYMLWGAEVFFAIIAAGLVWWAAGKAFDLEENQRATRFVARKIGFRR